jgi:hypothetical protein
MILVWGFIVVVMLSFVGIIASWYVKRPYTGMAMSIAMALMLVGVLGVVLSCLSL